MTIRIKKEWIGMLLLIIILSILFVINQESDEVIEEVIVQEASMIKVYISGEVKIPGVYEVESKDRLDVVIKLAGGFTEKADTRGVNLARLLKDGEMIVVYEQGDDVVYIGLDIFNYGDTTVLESVEGIGEVLAKRIVDYRESNGLYTTYEDLLVVDGIGAQKLKMIQSSVDD
ncbi:MAG: SLBB domain-containing protein [Clostridiales bacterium]|nr:SLBB domain-containing protein [Clostridiales bacterium]